MVTITPVLNGIPLSKFKRNIRLIDNPDAAKRTILNGISPIFAFSRIYENGMERPDYIYPIYSTKSMQEARQMNRIAIMQAKHPVEYTYTKATKEDLIRLTSEEAEYTTSRVTWTNPKDGNVYHILKERTTQSGNIIVRILDKDGAFLKEAEIKPKTILVVDKFGDKEKPIKFCPLIKNSPTHGEIVCKFIQKYNPLAKIIIDSESAWCLDDILIRRIQNYEKIDYVNISLGFEGEGDICAKLAESSEPYDGTWKKLNELLEQNNIRVIMSSGNEGKKCKNLLLMLNDVEGCGSINSKGKISEFSSSRNSKFTQHYEQAEFKLEKTEKGIKIVGPDIIIPYDTYQDIAGKNLDDVRTELIKERKNLKQLGVRFMPDENRNMMPVFVLDRKVLAGTSLATPTRTAKLALNDMMKDVM